MGPGEPRWQSVNHPHNHPILLERSFPGTVCAGRAVLHGINANKHPREGERPSLSIVLGASSAAAQQNLCVPHRLPVRLLWAAGVALELLLVPELALGASQSTDVCSEGRPGGAASSPAPSRLLKLLAQPCRAPGNQGRAWKTAAHLPSPPSRPWAAPSGAGGAVGLDLESWVCVL